MAIELARTLALPRPWGVADLRPWNNAANDGSLIGEIWYERPEKSTADPSLLLKLLFTSEPLSIQVHPDDAYAQSMGLPNGKTEAWYVLSAAPGAKVALGLKRRLTQQQLREAVDDGSIRGSCRVATPSCLTTSFSCPPERFTRSAQGSSLPRSNSAATQRSVCSITVASASFTSKKQSRWQSPDQLVFGRDRTGLPTNGRFSSPAPTSCSSGSICRRAPLGVWRRNERPGFSF